MRITKRFITQLIRYDLPAMTLLQQCQRRSLVGNFSGRSLPWMLIWNWWVVSCASNEKALKQQRIQFASYQKNDAFIFIVPMTALYMKYTYMYND